MYFLCKWPVGIPTNLCLLITLFNIYKLYNLEYTEKLKKKSECIEKETLSNTYTRVDKYC